MFCAVKRFKPCEAYGKIRKLKNHVFLRVLCHFTVTIRFSTAQKMKFSIKDFFCKCKQKMKLRIWSHSLKKSLMEIFIFCAVLGYVYFEEHLTMATDLAYL